MKSSISHTIRFSVDDKKKIVAIGKINNRGFQAQVTHMLQEQMKQVDVTIFLEELRKILEEFPEDHRKDMMAKIANMVVKE